VRALLQLTRVPTHLHACIHACLHRTDRSPHRSVPSTTPTDPRGDHTRLIAAAHPACPSSAQVFLPAERFISRSLRRRHHCRRCSQAV